MKNLSIKLNNGECMQISCDSYSFDPATDDLLVILAGGKPMVVNKLFWVAVKEV